MDFIKNLVNENTSQKSVQKALLGLIIANIVIVIIFVIFFSVQLDAASNRVYMVNADGNVTQANQVPSETYRPIEAQAHARLFVMSFYNITKLNYKDQIRKSFDLGGKELIAHFEALKSNQVYEDLEKDNIIFSVENLETEIVNSNRYPYEIRVKFRIVCEPSQYYKRKIYRISELLTIRDADSGRSEKNPHDMFIDKLVTEDWTDITSQIE